MAGKEREHKRLSVVEVALKALEGSVKEKDADEI
jgi:hypothetical protein